MNGVPAIGTLPGNEVRIPNDRAARGTIEFESTITNGPPPATFDWLPRYMEVTSENLGLLAPFHFGTYAGCGGLSFLGSIADAPPGG